MRKRFVLGQVLALAVLAIAPRAEAQVRFYIDGGKQTTTMEYGAATELTAKVKIAKAKRSKKFDEIGAHLEFEGNLGVHELTLSEAQKQFLKRFKGDELTIRIVPAGGNGTILMTGGGNLTFENLIDGAQLEERTTNKITLTIKGWKIAGYKTERVWKEGEEKWVEEKKPNWKSTTLAEGVFEITKIPPKDLTIGKTPQQLWQMAESYLQMDPEKALVFAEAAVKAGIAEAHSSAAIAACMLKNESLAAEHLKETPKSYKTTVKARCKMAGVVLN